MIEDKKRLDEGSTPELRQVDEVFQTASADVRGPDRPRPAGGPWFLLTRINLSVRFSSIAVAGFSPRPSTFLD